jgi:hypothetical protein
MYLLVTDVQPDPLPCLRHRRRWWHRYSGPTDRAPAIHQHRGHVQGERKTRNSVCSGQAASAAHPEKGANSKPLVHSKSSVQSQRMPMHRLPLLHAPENLLKRANAAKAEVANAEAGPSRLMVTGSPQVVAGQDLLVLPPMPREVFNELTSMFNEQLPHRTGN